MVYNDHGMSTPFTPTLPNTPPHLDGSRELGPDGVCEVGREGPVDVGAQLVEVDLDHLVVRGPLIGAEVLLERVGSRRDPRPLRRLRGWLFMAKIYTTRRLGWIL